MEAFLSRLEEAIKKYLKEAYLPPHRAKTPGWTYHDLKFFYSGVDDLSTVYTEERGSIPKDYLNKKEFRTAYLLYFTLINAAKVWHALSEAQKFLPQKGSLKILDLGCGPATASLACADFFKDRPLEIFGLDQNLRVQKDGYQLWNRMRNPKQSLKIQSIALHPKNIAPLIRGKNFDLAIASNFLSELDFNSQIAISKEVLKESKNFIIIEPALQKTTRALMQLRDRLLRDRRAFILAPCLHQQNCPMLAANKRDWCHFYIDWKCPLLIREIDELIGNRHDYVKMAYMVLSRQPLPMSQNLWRVVSSPLISKGKKEFILCGDCGYLKKITRLNKHQNEENQSFDTMKRGDVIEWKDGPVKIIKSF